MNQKALVSLEVTVNNHLFTFQMPVNGLCTYGDALDAASKIAADLQEFIKELDAKKEQPSVEVVEKKED